MIVFGIEIFVSKDQPIKHPGPICAIPLGIEISVIFLIKLLLPGNKVLKSFPGREKVILKNFTSEDSSRQSSDADKKEALFVGSSESLEKVTEAGLVTLGKGLISSGHSWKYADVNGRSSSVETASVETTSSASEGTTSEGTASEGTTSEGTARRFMFMSYGDHSGPRRT